MFADIQAAIQMEQRITKSKASMRDLLNKTCASYNKMTSIKKHRIDGARKSLLYNLCLSLFGDQLVLFFIFPLNFGQENMYLRGLNSVGIFSFIMMMVWSKAAIPKRLPRFGPPTLRFLSSSAIRLGFGGKKEFTTVRILSIWARIAVGDIGPGVLGAWLNCEGRMPTVSWKRTVQWDSQSNWWNSLPLRIPSFSGPLIYANNVFYFCCCSSVLFSTKVWTYMI